MPMPGASETVIFFSSKTAPPRMWSSLQSTRAVQVHFGDDLLGAGQLHGCVDRDLGFQHTADHALHAVDLRRRGNAEGVGDAAALHQLDVHEMAAPVCMMRRASAGLNTLSSASTGTLAWRVTYCIPSRSAAGTGSLNELDVQALLLHLVEDTDSLLLHSTPDWRRCGA